MRSSPPYPYLQNETKRKEVIPRPGSNMYKSVCDPAMILEKEIQRRQPTDRHTLTPSWSRTKRMREKLLTLLLYQPWMEKNQTNHLGRHLKQAAIIINLVIYCPQSRVNVFAQPSSCLVYKANPVTATVACFSSLLKSRRTFDHPGSSPSSMALTGWFLALTLLSGLSYLL